MVKNPPANAGDTGDAGSIPGSGRAPGGGNGNQFQYSCLKNSMDRGAWQVAVHRVSKGLDMTEHILQPTEKMYVIVAVVRLNMLHLSHRNTC